ncbi:MAG: hypothetical protein K0U98_21435 [Deltaproteobacteria bacterium]|nr:hypothetical protein [Deltaproteobacteria bacterium]
MRLNQVGTKKPRKGSTRLIPVVGIDIGQKRDPTAIAVAEIEYRPITDLEPDRSEKESHYLARYLERLPLGTPYPEIARRLGEICQRVSVRCGRRPTVFVDATGVGKPIVDVLKASTREARLLSVYFTHGDRRTEHSDDGKVTLGKAYLVSRLQALLQCQRLHLPETGESRALAQELLDYEIRVDENANDRYGAFRVGTHDDLVTAIGLAVQKEPTISVYPGSVHYGL